jgi:release factor glutamine methyltransferase
MNPSYRDLINDATQILYESSDSPRIDAEVLMQHAISQSLAWLMAYGDSVAEASHSKHFFTLVEQRQAGKPIAYLLGYKEFWSLRLEVNEHVLVPRADTEILVEQCLERINVDQEASILDLGTGSGAIALALAKERPNSRVTAVDSQTAALQVARDNALANNLNNVGFVRSDWFSEIGEQRFNMIAANPPYVASDDEHLSRGDLRFEPITALAAKSDGLSDIDQIINTAPSFLLPNGWLIVEHGYQQGEQVSALFEQAGFSNIGLYVDLNKLPRCTAGQWVRM